MGRAELDVSLTYLAHGRSNFEDLCREHGVNYVFGPDGLGELISSDRWREFIRSATELNTLVMGLLQAHYGGNPAPLPVLDFVFYVGQWQRRIAEWDAGIDADDSIGINFPRELDTALQAELSVTEPAPSLPPAVQMDRLELMFD